MDRSPWNKTLHTTKRTIRRAKSSQDRKTKQNKNILTNYTSHTWMIARIYKELQRLNTKEITLLHSEWVSSLKLSLPIFLFVLSYLGLSVFVLSYNFYLVVCLLSYERQKRCEGLWRGFKRSWRRGNHKQNRVYEFILIKENIERKRKSVNTCEWGKWAKQRLTVLSDISQQQQV